MPISFELHNGQQGTVNSHGTQCLLHVKLPSLYRDPPFADVLCILCHNLILQLKYLKNNRVYFDQLNFEMFAYWPQSA